MEKINPKAKIVKLQPKVESRSVGEVIVPALRISGKWLQDNGFYEGKEVVIIYGYEYMIIYPYKKPTS